MAALGVVLTLAANALVQASPSVALAAAVVCNRYCDGRDPGLATADRVPVSSTLYGRSVKVHVNDTDAMAWGSIENGQAGDEVWLDRSFDGGRSWADGSRLGATAVPAGQGGWRTGQFNVDDWNAAGVGALRACGKAGDRPEITCTAWTRSTWNALGSADRGGDRADDAVRPRHRAVRRQRVVDRRERAHRDRRQRQAQRHDQLQVRDCQHLRQERQRPRRPVPQRVPGRHRLVGPGLGGRVRRDR